MMLMSSEERGERRRRNRDDLEDLTMLTFLQRSSLLRERRISRPPVPDVRASTDRIEEEGRAWHDSRFRKRDMRRLYMTLGFPDLITLPNGSVLRGEEAFLLLLGRMR